MHRTDTRQQILDTASVLFHNHNYSDVGIAAICDRAGVSKGSFFHFFRSKRDLAVAVMDGLMTMISDTLLTDAFSDTYPPMERIDRFVSGLYAFQKQQRKVHGHLPGCPFGNLAMEQGTQDDVLRDKANSCLRSMAGHFAAALDEAMRCGDVPDLDVTATADAMVGYLEGIQLLAKARNDAEVIRQLGPAVKAIRIPAG